MSTNGEAGDWVSLDPWWETYTRPHSIARTSAETRTYRRSNVARHWKAVDSWWDSHVDSNSTAQISNPGRVLGMEQFAQPWEELGPWWEAYTEIGHQTAVEIADELEESNERWHTSKAPFDTDPLSADLTRHRRIRGPLQPGKEVNWSRWLARLLRPSDTLVSELFGVDVAHPPDEVTREKRLPKQDGSFRRPDILIQHAELGVSVEVKLGDTNYQKTPDTAHLVEQQHDTIEWEHTLLLPQRKTEKLEAIVSPPLTRRGDGQLHIEWETPGPIDVVYWRDVTATIRSILRRGIFPDDHWAANAYLFCAVAEQQLIGFHPQSTVERVADPNGVVDTMQPIGVADTLAEQITYLRERVER